VLKVGLTGGIASGKTFVGEALASWGCCLIQADEIGRRVMAPGGEAYDGVVREFGPEILAPDGSIDRPRLAALVFQNPERLARLNAHVHPPVLRREEEMAAEFFAREPHGIAVVEAAILIETGSYRRYDRLILAFSAPQQQIERAMRRAGAKESDVRARIERQMPLEEKRKYADYVIDTSGTKEETLQQTRVVYEALRKLETEQLLKQG
jgi:dephospho-CoA kinase